MIEENDNYKAMFYFLSPNDFLFFLNSQIKCFIFPQKFCVVYLIIKWRHKTSITFIFTFFENLTFFGNQREFTIKILKNVGNVV